MSKSSFSHGSGLGCGQCSGSSHSGLGCPGCDGKCGCSGLGDSYEDTKNQVAENTSTDIVQTAKNYVNDEIPMRYKYGALALGAGLIYWKGRKSKK